MTMEYPTLKKLRPVSMDDAQWARVQDAARELAAKEGRAVSAAEVVRRAVDTYLPPPT
ncbi:MAG: hypothetical protein AB1941_01850 [Gemmatimonadota bacterium]